MDSNILFVSYDHHKISVYFSYCVCVCCGCTFRLRLAFQIRVQWTHPGKWVPDCMHMRECVCAVKYYTHIAKSPIIKSSWRYCCHCHCHNRHCYRCTAVMFQSFYSWFTPIWYTRNRMSSLIFHSSSFYFVGKEHISSFFGCNVPVFAQNIAFIGCACTCICIHTSTVSCIVLLT